MFVTSNSKSAALTHSVECLSASLNDFKSTHCWPPDCSSKALPTLAAARGW